MCKRKKREKGGIWDGVVAVRACVCWGGGGGGDWDWEKIATKCARKRNLHINMMKGKIVHCA